MNAQDELWITQTQIEETIDEFRNSDKTVEDFEYFLNEIALLKGYHEDLRWIVRSDYLAAIAAKESK